MRSTSWLALLNRIPPDQHDKLMLVTSSGTEIAISALLMTEGDCLAIRGRVSGSQDSGRVFFIPYDHVDYLGFARQVSEEEFRAFFGEGGSLVRSDAAAFAPARAESNSTTPLPDSVPVVSPADVAPRTMVPNRAALLESIRARGLTARGNGASSNGPGGT